MATSPASSVHTTELTAFFKKPHQKFKGNEGFWIPNCHEYAIKTIVVETVDAQLFQLFSRTWRIVLHSWTKEGHVPRPRSTEGLTFVLLGALLGQAYARECCAEWSKTQLTMKSADIRHPALCLTPQPFSVEQNRCHSHNNSHWRFRKREAKTAGSCQEREVPVLIAFLKVWESSHLTAQAELNRTCHWSLKAGRVFYLQMDLFVQMEFGQCFALTDFQKILFFILLEFLRRHLPRLSTWVSRVISDPSENNHGWNSKKRKKKKVVQLCFSQLGAWK